MASDEFLYQGVKPKCVEGRWLSVHMDRRHHSLQLTHYVSPCALEATVTTVPLPHNFSDRIIGRPVCIACRHPVYILQYVTEQCKYLRFMLVNLLNNQVQLFEDGEKYFNRDFSSICPVECMINPDLTQALFRLPQTILSSRKWSKMLSTKISVCSDINASSSNLYAIENLRCESLRDRKNQAVVFDPHYVGRVVHVLVNSYCSKCTIMVYDLQTRKTVSEQDKRLIQRDIYRDESDDDSYVFLLQCSADYSRSGDVLLLCCAVQSSQGDSYVRLYMFSAHTFHMLRCIEFSALKLSLKLSADARLLTAPIPSPCDQWVQLWALEKGRPVRPLPTLTRIPHAVSLQGLCRAVIVHVCLPGSVPRLQLPPRLQAYLQFKTLIHP